MTIIIIINSSNCITLKKDFYVCLFIYLFSIYCYLYLYCYMRKCETDFFLSNFYILLSAHQEQKSVVTFIYWKICYFVSYCYSNDLSHYNLILEGYLTASAT